MMAGLETQTVLRHEHDEMRCVYGYMMRSTVMCHHQVIYVVCTT